MFGLEQELRQLNLNRLFQLLKKYKGGAGSGNWGHAGIPGKRGGSAARSSGMSLRTGRDWKQRRQLVKGTKISRISSKDDSEKAKSQYLRNDPRKYGRFDTKTTQAQKDEIVTNLSQKTGLSYEAVNAAIKTWAISSNNANPTSLDIQKVASELFDAPLSEYQKGKMEGLPPASSFDKDTGPYGTPKAATQAFLSTMYDVTQEEFKKGGIKTVTLYRGTKNSFPPGTSKSDTLRLEQNTLESWTLDPVVADMFGSNVIKAQVPVERILATARTGFGCLNEWEFIVIGGKSYDTAEVEKTS